MVSGLALDSPIIRWPRLAKFSQVPQRVWPRQDQEEPLERFQRGAWGASEDHYALG